MSRETELRSVLRQVHHFWFGPLSGPEDFPAERAPIWFERRDTTDEAIRTAFGGDLDGIAAQRWRLDALSPAERVGLVVALDQFPRNLFRGDGRAFIHDARARHLSRRIVAHGAIDEYCLVERVFLLLPFEHSERLADQDFSVAEYLLLTHEAPEAQRDIYARFLDYAEKHRMLIRRFGRFPHRNADLGRESTPEEAAFLAEHGRGY
jgi:uncharacterized protein (DUF924 family)